MRHAPLILLLVGCTPATVSAPEDAAQVGAKDAQALPDREIVDFGFRSDIGPAPRDVGFLDAAPGFADARPPGPDRDGDGIPDDEDPEPNTPNALLFADTFDAEDPSWLFGSASMRVDSARSALRVAQVEPLVREGWLGPRQQWASLWMRALVRPTRVGSSANPGTGRFGILGRVTQIIPDSYVLCGIDMRTQEVFISEHDGGGAAGRTVVREAVTVAADAWTQITFEINGSRMKCSVGGVTASSTTNAFPGGSAGFRTFDVAFEADWFEVYDR